MNHLTLTIDLPNIGDKKRYVCPHCNGGSKHERCLMARRTESGIYVKCYRNSCTFTGGFINNTGEVQYNTKATKPDTRFTKPLIKIEGKLYAPSEDRYMYPIYDWYSVHHGYAGRSRSINTYPKWKLYYDNYESFDGLYFPESCRLNVNDNLVLVEDIISADVFSRIVPNVHCAALLGTDVTLRAAAYAVRLGYRNIFIALDNDATLKAHKHAKMLAPMFSSVTVIPLLRDIKDMKVDDVIKLSDKYIRSRV